MWKIALICIRQPRGTAIVQELQPWRDTSHLRSPNQISIISWANWHIPKSSIESVCLDVTYLSPQQTVFVCVCVCEYSECLHIHIWIPSWKINFLEPLRDWQSVRGRIARCIHTLSITWPTVDRPFTLLFLPRRVSLIIHPTNQPSIYPSISGEWVSEYTHCTRMFVLRETDRQTDLDVVAGGECGRYVYIDRDTNVKMLSAGPTTMTTNDVNNINVNNEHKQRHQPTDRRRQAPVNGMGPNMNAVLHSLIKWQQRSWLLLFVWF